MRIVIYPAALLLVLSSTGCLWSHQRDQSPPPAVWVAPSATTNSPETNNTFTITPVEGPNGRVASVNPGLEFVVLTFPVGQVPRADQHLSIYRNGSKVGEVKVTGPQREDNTVADILSGGAIKGDEVREK